MATKTVANGGGNWNAPGTWVEGSIATSVDDVVFTGTSGQLTVNVASAAKTINFTSYVNTITFNAALTVSGSVTLANGPFTQAGASGITLNAAATLTSNGVTWSRPLSITGAVTYTLADDWTVSGLLTIGTTANATVINGAFNLNASGGLTITQTTGTITGTATIRMVGTGTVDGTAFTSGSLQNNFAINTAGTVTFGGNLNYRTGTLTYTAGTVITTGSTLTLGASTTLDTNGMTWNNITIPASGTTVTLSSNLRSTGATGLITTTNGTATFAGAGAWDCDNVRFATSSSTSTTGVVITLQSGNSYRCRGSLLIGGTKTAPSTIQGSSVGGTKATLTLDTSGTQGVVYVTAIDINSNGGRLIRNLLGTDTRTQNWQEVTTLMPVAAYVFVQ